VTSQDLLPGFELRRANPDLFLANNEQLKCHQRGERSQAQDGGATTIFAKLSISIARLSIPVDR
jgi:hypothetical protein